MPTQTLTIPGRTYPVGTTTGQRSLAGNQTYSHADVTVDFTGWVSTATTRVGIEIAFSLDGGVTWQPLVAFSETAPPPYTKKDGSSTNSVTVSWDTPAALDPTHLRGSVSVEGQAVTLGPITINAQ